MKSYFSGDEPSNRLSGLRGLSEEQLDGVQYLAVVIVLGFGMLFQQHPATHIFGKALQGLILNGGGLLWLAVQCERIRRI